MKTGTCFILMIIVLIGGCSGGNSSSSGSGGAAATENSSGSPTDVRAGEYSGNITFDGLNESTRVTINVSDNGSVTIDAGAGGAAIGDVTGSSFSASGNMEFVFSDQTCTSSTSFDGTASGNTLQGTVSAPSATCVQDGDSYSTSLDGEFTASK